MLYTILTIASGVAWTIVYIEAIRLGFRYRTYAIPIGALALNLAWESTYAFVDLSRGGWVQGVINLVWALADVVILSTYFRFGRAELPSFVSRGMFIAWGVALLAIGYTVQWLFIPEFGITAAPALSAFLQNALMSGLFIAMFVSRRGSRGQSLLLATAKWLGTLAPTISVGIVYHFNPLVLGLGIICSVLDLGYIGLLLWARRNPSLITQKAPNAQLAAVG